jgi:hypothetical protein
MRQSSRSPRRAQRWPPVLLRIEERLGDAATFPGWAAFPRFRR